MEIGRISWNWRPYWSLTGRLLFYPCPTPLLPGTLESCPSFPDILCFSSWSFSSLAPSFQSSTDWMASAIGFMKCSDTLCTKTINRTFPLFRFASFFRSSFCFAFLRIHRRMRFILLLCFKISFKLFWGTVFILMICHVCESISERCICVFVRKFGADNGFFGHWYNSNECRKIFR